MITDDQVMNTHEMVFIAIHVIKLCYLDRVNQLLVNIELFKFRGNPAFMRFH